jgi:hypothetical protein
MTRTMAHGCLLHVDAELKDEGNALFQRRAFKDAMSKYRKALRLMPFEVPVLTNMAQVCLYTRVCACACACACALGREGSL